MLTKIDIMGFDLLPQINSTTLSYLPGISAQDRSERFQHHRIYSCLIYVFPGKMWTEHIKRIDPPVYVGLRSSLCFWILQALPSIFKGSV